MPYKKITRGKNKGKYRSKDGKVLTLKQIQAYYAGKGKKKGKWEILG